MTDIKAQLIETLKNELDYCNAILNGPSRHDWILLSQDGQLSLIQSENEYRFGAFEKAHIFSSRANAIKVALVWNSLPATRGTDREVRSHSIFDAAAIRHIEASGMIAMLEAA